MRKKESYKYDFQIIYTYKIIKNIPGNPPGVLNKKTIIFKNS